MPVQEVSATRQQALQQIQNQHFDVLVIGGGITGLGVAVDAATRGLKVALVSAYLYFDAMADDARVCIALARTAASHGAAVLNYAPVEKILHDQQGRACGAIVKPRDANSITINARVIVNAAGVWSDEVMTTDEGKNPESIRPAKGVHLTVPWKMVRNDIAVVIPVPGDKRSLFLVPWISNYDGTYQYTYIGTTDTDYQGSIDDPQCTRVDIDYVLRALNAAVTTNVTADDVTAVWSGLRPLVKSVSGEKLSSRTADAALQLQ
ncbi:MAG: FAD-dependent oxidoreductase [Actinobacteria bacterium]|nr:FAD-dependent oxidoreductase [Actinomycetota bacterium]